MTSLKKEYIIHAKYYVKRRNLFVKNELPKNFVLQRKNVEGQMNAPLDLKIWKKIGICSITMGLVLSLTGCGNWFLDMFTKRAEIGSLEEGFRLNTYFEEDVRRATEEYNLIKFDGKIHVAYTFSSVDSNTGNLVFRYYDIKDKTFLGMSLIEPKSYDLESKGALSDYLYCNGSYELGKILPFGASINLSRVVTSTYPREQDLEFWSSNSEETQKRFNDILFVDATFTMTKDLGSGTDDNGTKQDILKYDSKIPAQVFICTKNDGQTDILIGYRASENESDVGYNYVYDVIEGTITYIGRNSIDAYVKVDITNAPYGLTIKQIAEEYDIEIVYTTDNVESSTASNEQSIESDNTNAMSQSELADAENHDTTQSDIDNSVIETPKEKYYKNGEIMILDVKALKEAGAVEYCEDDDIDYVILLEGEKYGSYGLERALIDLMDDGSFAHQTADPTTVYYGNGSLRIHIKTISQAKTIYTPSSLLRERGEVDDIQNEYSLKDLMKLYERLNNRKKVNISKDMIKMFDTSSVNDTSGWILVEEKTDGSGAVPYYCNPFNPEFKLNLIGEYVYYRENDDNSSIRLKSSSVVTLEDYLNEIGRTDLLKDKYSRGELISLSEALEEQNLEHNKTM